MNNVQCLKPEFLTADIVLDNVKNEKPEQVVVLTFKNGEPIGLWCSADTSILPAAALKLNYLATKYVNGELENE